MPLWVTDKQNGHQCLQSDDVCHNRLVDQLANHNNIVQSICGQGICMTSGCGRSESRPNVLASLGNTITSLHDVSTGAHLNSFRTTTEIFSRLPGLVSTDS